MRIVESVCTASLNAAALAPDTPYVYRILPRASTSVAVISSDDALRSLCAEKLSLISEVQHKGVTCLEPVPGPKRNEGKVLLTAGRYGDVRLWDGNEPTARVVIDSGVMNLPITSLASQRVGNIFATGMEQAHSVASVALWDIRFAKKPVAHYAECHNDDVTELKFSDTEAAILLSGSTDGLVNIYNTTVIEEDDVLLQVINHGASINHAGFIRSSASDHGTSTSNNTVYALSHDESLSLYHRCDASSDEEMALGEADEKPEAPIFFGDLRPKLDCEYVIDIILTGAGIPPLSVVGFRVDERSEQRLTLMPIDSKSGWEINHDAAIELAGAHGEEIVRSISATQSHVYYTGGEDGQIKVWRIEDVLNTEHVVENKNGAPERQRKKREMLYKPY